MNKLPIILCIIGISLFSCKKEKTTWSTNWSAPLVHGHLTLDDLIDPQYSTTNTANYLSIVFNETVFSFSLDTLIDLPDTTILKKTAVALPTVSVNPSFVYGDVYDQAYELDQIELKRVIVKSGEVEMVIRSPWSGKSKVTFDFPKILDQGIPFNRIFYLDPGSTSNLSVDSEIIDMTGFDMDLTGVSGLLYNTISGDIFVGSNEAVNSYDVFNTDSVEYEITFTDLIPNYAKGYFGSYTLSDTTGLSLPFMNAIIGGSIDIDSIDINVSIMNGFNLLAQAKITQLQGLSSITGGTTDLSFPMLGNSMNINPATGDMYSWAPSQFPVVINNNNSNITSFIEDLPDSLRLGYELIINPSGNITAGSDELFPGSTMDVVVSGEFPLDFGADALAITDTFDLSYTGSASYTGEVATISLSYDNGFPVGANTVFYMLDNNNAIIDSLVGDVEIQSGVYNSISYLTTPSSGLILFNLTEMNILNLELTSKMAIVVDFTTDGAQKVKLDADAFFDFNLRSNLQISLQL